MITTLTLNPAIDRELTVEMFRYDAVVTAMASRVDPGGKGFNVSRALKALGVDSLAMGFAGGHTGALLEASLRALGITADLVRIAGETRTNTSIVTANHGHTLKINEAGPMIGEGEAADLIEKLRRLIHAGDWWVLAGSLPPGLPDDFYARLITLIHAGGAKAILDTSREALRLGCAAGPDLIKPNQTEATELTGMAIDPNGDLGLVIERMRALGARDVLLSLGKDGAVYAAGDRLIHAVPPRIIPRNPIGAGDAMVAGMAWALSEGLSAEDALRWGTACGAAAASLAGTGFSTRSDVETLLSGVSLIE